MEQVKNKMDNYNGVLQQPISSGFNANTTTDGGKSAAAHKMTIDQSGRYFQITIDQQRFSLKQAARESLKNRTGPDAVRITVGSGPNELTFTGLLTRAAIMALIATLIGRRVWRSVGPSGQTRSGRGALQESAKA